MSEWLTRLKDNAHELTIDARFAYLALALTGISIALLHFVEVWGHARARRRTARAIAQTEREGPPEAHTWEHTHSIDKN
jgi:lipopolysaccharide export LptBFGC system permease protein LptF